MDDARDDDRLLFDAHRDPEAFAVFYRRHVAAVLAFTRARTGDTEAAADLTADVFVAAYAARRRYRPRREPARAWLFAIANKHLAMRSRKLRRGAVARARFAAHGGYTPEALQDAGRDLDGLLGQGHAETLVAGLPPAERDAVLARVVDERGYPEIAAAAGISQATARQRVSRGLARLAPQLRKDER